ncbi:MAG TPA: FGGY-family carbohydrate kinase, partial [Trueperaceae bacterium]|nr:FGGY-family carbohydrate kinase [Trueperaceae bacterium]
ALVRSTQVVGELGAGMADRLGLPRGTPVVAGAGDNASAAVALGLSADAVPVQGSVSLGTSGVVQVPIAVPRPDPQGRVHLFADALGGYLLLGVTLAAAGSLRWYRDTVAPIKSFAELLSLAAESTPSAGGVTFLPYLAGERTPHMRADLRGSFQGLSLATTAADMVRAVVQGVAYSLRDALDVMRPLFSAGTGAGHDAPQRFLATGGGAASDMWLETLATLFGVPVERPLGDDGAAHQVGAAEGAAMLAWRALGVTVDTSPPGRHVFEPSTAAADELESGYARYLELSRRAQEESR